MRSDGAVHATLRLAPTRAIPVPTAPTKSGSIPYDEPGFQQLATTLEGLLDRLGGNPEDMAGHYRTTMGLELAFFDSPTSLALRSVGERPSRPTAAPPVPAQLVPPPAASSRRVSASSSGLRSTRRGTGSVGRNVSAVCHARS
jgi:hypothetical protein